MLCACLVYGNTLPNTLVFDDLELIPHQTDLNLGNLYHEMGEIDKTIDAFLMVVYLAPDFIKAYENLGLLYLDTGRMVEAEAIFRETLKRDPDNVLAREKLQILEEKR